MHTYTCISCISDFFVAPVNCVLINPFIFMTSWVSIKKIIIVGCGGLFL